MKKNKRNDPQTCLEQCKYKMKKRKLKNFIDDKVILSSDYEADE